jgi:hypothetical protein
VEVFKAKPFTEAWKLLMERFRACKEANRIYHSQAQTPPPNQPQRPRHHLGPDDCIAGDCLQTLMIFELINGCGDMGAGCLDVGFCAPDCDVGGCL